MRELWNRLELTKMWQRFRSKSQISRNYGINSVMICAVSYEENSVAKIIMQKQGQQAKPLAIKAHCKGFKT